MNLNDKLKLEKFGRPVISVLNGYDKNINVVSDEKYINSEHLLITYTGMTYPQYQDAGPLFKAIKDYRGVLPINVIFYGRGNDYLIDYAKEFGVNSNVSILRSVSYPESLALQSSSDILLYLLWNDPNEDGIFSGKLFEYIGTGRPLLSIGRRSGEVADLAESLKP